MVSLFEGKREREKESLTDLSHTRERESAPRSVKKEQQLLASSLSLSLSLPFFCAQVSGAQAGAAAMSLLQSFSVPEAMSQSNCTIDSPHLTRPKTMSQ